MAQVFANPTREDVRRVWGDAPLRVFLSHRDSHRVAATRLAMSLRDGNVGVFVAHDTIRPTARWHGEIEIALRTMDVLLAFVTDDFNESAWTSQEVGFAVGRRCEVIVLKLDGAQIGGFIELHQGLEGSLAEPEASVDAIIELLSVMRTHRTEAEELVDEFVRAGSFKAALTTLARMQESIVDLSDDDLERICDGFRSNENLNGSDALRWKKNLPAFLERTTGKSVVLNGCEIRVLS